MTPYYDHAGITIYHGDCADVLPWLEADVLITDPPYGVNMGECGAKNQGWRHGMQHDGYDCYEDTYENFTGTIVPRLNLAIERTKRALVWTGPHIHEQRKPDAIGGVFCPSGAGRNVWGFKSLLPVLLYGTAPDLHKGAKTPTAIWSQERSGKDALGHPCPKPDKWMTWSVQLASLPGEIIVDPFMGAGGTLKSAKNMGRRAVGVDLSERYCEIAAKRLAQETLFGVTP